VLPTIAPGPLRAAPDAPLIPAAPPPAAPALPEILVTVPDNIDTGGPNVPSAGADVAADSTAVQAAHSVAQAAALSGTASDGETGATSDVNNAGGTQPVRELLVFSGGRGEALSADLGRSGAFGSAFDVFAEDDLHAGKNRKRSR